LIIGARTITLVWNGERRGAAGARLYHACALHGPPLRVRIARSRGAAS